ncbi:MAG: hypothetical protein CVV64_04840 [Candidatus Wallbacteria bacterium HGW-Wallbacteria-1]|jgi:hypothetical protein|uniref:Peptidase M28 domain-containing protein n=1 Tax=Candidatus Wallbacteria bacterium HGW-Wallbacteria-1 TaxID=2013854 RepID=A0A2N1PRZ2_9BACT|nr:MAG: hypothetical protein CVV64_04840 [Candidatus Wallbacteria bacterium HGW-Wallbacteria-1]
MKLKMKFRIIFRLKFNYISFEPICLALFFVFVLIGSSHSLSLQNGQANSVKTEHGKTPEENRVRSSDQYENVDQPASSVCFSGNNAFDFASRMCAMGPRVPGTAGWKSCQDLIETSLTGIGYQVERIPFTISDNNGNSVNFVNIIAFPVMPSYSSTKNTTLILCAHYDTRPFAEKDTISPDTPISGANDGASGTAVLLELARVLRTIPLEIKPVFIFFDGEDYGRGIQNMLHGSRNYVSRLSEAEIQKIRTVILLDMIGDRDLAIPMEPNSMDSDPQTMNEIWKTASELGVSQFKHFPGPRISDDHIPFHWRGIKAIDLIDFDYPHWHTTRDTIDKISGESMAAVGKVLQTYICKKWKRQN